MTYVLTKLIIKCLEFLIWVAVGVFETILFRQNGLEYMR